MNEGKKLRGALIGCGYFAQFHREAWSRIAGVEIVAACDPRAERAASSAPLSFTSVGEMLTRCALDFVDIATRPESHPEIVRLAAAHKLHAICQKPMAPDIQESRGMSEAARAAGVRLMIHDNWRWQPWYRQAAAIVASGKIGQPIGYGLRTGKRDGAGPEPYAAQPYFRRMPRFLIYEVLVHHLDVARFLFGEIASIYALARRRNETIAGEDQALLTLRHRSGVDGWIDGNRHVNTVPDGPVMGSAFIDGDEGALTITPAGDVLRNGEIEWNNNAATGYRGDSVYNTQVHFIQCLRSGATFETDAADYLNTVAAVEAAYGSIDTGLPVML